MKREPVESEVIASMGYNPVWRVLEIEFRQSREIYAYFSVPPEEYSAFLGAESKGIYLNTIFKSHNYRFERCRLNPTGESIRKHLASRPQLERTRIYKGAA